MKRRAAFRAAFFYALACRKDRLHLSREIL
jgi:hypothetical protein